MKEKPYHHGDLRRALIETGIDFIKQKGEEALSLRKINVYIISDTGTIRHCVGCFGCWIKTPGKCVLKDGYDNLGELLSKSEKLTIISRCFYGCYSPFVKNVLDSSISYISVRTA